MTGEKEGNETFYEAKQIEALKREMFGEKAPLATIRTLGSGISETTRISLPVLAHPDLLKEMAPPWTENRDMIVRLFTAHYERGLSCPGREQEQCCQAGPGQSCSPNWREREDPEWYARQINMLLSQVNYRVTQNGPLVPALAADEAFELGCLFSEAVIKFNWDDHAKAGRKSYDGGKKGRSAQQKTTQEDDAVVYAMVKELIDGRTPKMAAYAAVGKLLFTPSETVRRQFSRYQKSHW